jgi:stringent starvation protein B
MSRKTRLPAKRDVALALLESSTLYLHLDPRHGEVKVPPWFKKQPQLVLQVGLNMPVPIPDLNLDDDGVSCTLSFNRSPHFCYVPWAAIYALVGEDGRGMVWPDDVPPEVAAQMHAQPTEPKPRARLHAVEEGSPTEPPKASAAAATPIESRAGSESAQEKKKLRKKAQKPRATPGSRRNSGRTARPMLAAVEDGPPPREKEPAKEVGEGSKKKRELPPYLRVVK